MAVDKEYGIFPNVLASHSKNDFSNRTRVTCYAMVPSRRL